MVGPQWGLTFGTWEDAEAMVGAELGSFEGADEVTRADIRRRLETLALDCPLHYDEQVAKDHGYRGVVSPTAMLMTWSMPPYWQPGEARPAEGDAAHLPDYPAVHVPAPGDSLFVVRSETAYGEPVYPGDRISGVSRLQSMNRKRTAVGDGAFLVVETIYRNQDAVVVGTERVTYFRYTAQQPGQE